MSTGTFILKVRQFTNEPWLEMERFRYDDLAHFKKHRRDGQLEEARMRKAGWISRYHRYRDASFQIVEETNYPIRRTVIDGPLEMAIA